MESNVSKIMLEIPHFFELQMQKYVIYLYLRVLLFTRRKRAMCIYIKNERILRGAEGVLTF
jgi:hypothetical protein